MRNSYDADFATDADYEDGFVESDGARAERLGLGGTGRMNGGFRRLSEEEQNDLPFDSNRSQGAAVANVQADGANVNVNINIAPKFDFSRKPENMEKFMDKIKSGYTRTAEERMSDELLKEQEDSEYRYVDEAFDKGYKNPTEMLEAEGRTNEIPSRTQEVLAAKHENKAAQKVMNKAEDVGARMSATERYNNLSAEEAANMSAEELSELARQAQEEAADSFDTP